MRAAPAARERRLGRAAPHRFDLPLEHRQPILLAAQRHRRALLLLTQAADHLQVGLRLLGQPAHVGFLHLAETFLDRPCSRSWLWSSCAARNADVSSARVSRSLECCSMNDGGEPVGDALRLAPGVRPT